MKTEVVMKLKFKVNKEGKKQIVICLNEESKKPFTDSALRDRDFLMVGDFRYFGIERFNYKRRYAI